MTQANQSNALAVVGGLMLAGMLVFGGYSFYSCSSHMEAKEQERQQEEARKTAEYAANMRMYEQLMLSMIDHPPMALRDVIKGIGRRYDQCERSKDLERDICYWFLNESGTDKIFSISLAAEGMAGSDKNKLLLNVVFARNGKVEKVIDSSMKQLVQGLQNVAVEQ